MKTILAIFVLSIVPVAYCSDLRQQISESITTGAKLEFGDSKKRFPISFIVPPDNDPSNKPSFDPLFYSIGQKITLVPNREETIKECRERIALYCLRCRENGHKPIIKIYIYLEYNTELLKALLDEVANQKVEKVWTHIQTKEELIDSKANKVELKIPKPLPPSGNNYSN